MMFGLQTALSYKLASKLEARRNAFPHWISEVGGRYGTFDLRETFKGVQSC